MMRVLFYAGCGPPIRGPTQKEARRLAVPLDKYALVRERSRTQPGQKTWRIDFAIWQSGINRRGSMSAQLK